MDKKVLKRSEERSQEKSKKEKVKKSAEQNTKHIAESNRNTTKTDFCYTGEEWKTKRQKA